MSFSSGLTRLVLLLLAAGTSGGFAAEPIRRTLPPPGIEVSADARQSLADELRSAQAA
jgi:hypothetical protein